MTTDLETRLQQSLGTAYTLERELAGGGMSRVFLALETSLGRRVVVKVLPPELVAGVSAERFLREVQVAARLQHPHIVPVHTADVAGELPFYTMPFVDGETLRGRISRAPIPIDEAVHILRDVARALEYAHAHGVVHRDIKPDNIFLAGNAAVVSDFGIAKAISAARTETEAAATADSVTHLTRAGVALGTPAYMSPEQAAGADHVDHRADIYSFGCVAYEVLSGSPPFVEREAHRLILAHITRPVPPLQQGAASVSPALAALVMRCLAKSPDDRPQSSRELVQALESVATPLESQTAVRGSKTWKAAVAAAVMLGVAWLGVQAIGSREAVVPPSGSGSALAVLPFVNIGGDTATEYFADGIADELATALARIPQVTVAARSGAYRYKGRRDLDLRDVARDLHVDLVLTGTARRADRQIRVSAQLSSAHDGVELWSETFIRPFNDVLALTDSLTSLISDALSRRLAATSTPLQQPTPVTTQLGTSNPVAYDTYLRGKYSLHRRRTGLEGAAGEFSEAIALDSTFARAHAGLATALALLTYYGDSQPPDRPIRSRDAALMALRLDSTNTEAHVALAILALTQHRWRDAEQAAQRAIALEPGLSDAHFHLGRALIYQGRTAEGVRSIEVARRLEPFSPIYAVWLGHTLGWAGRREQALAEVRRAWQLDSNSSLVHNLGVQAFLLLGDTAMARHVARIEPEPAFKRGVMSYVMARTGDAALARRLMQPVIDRRGERWFDYINLSLLYLGLGELDSALTYMERAAERGEPVGAFNSLTSTFYDPVRADPRFTGVLTRLGLDPGVVGAPGGGRVP